MQINVEGSVMNTSEKKVYQPPDVQAAYGVPTGTLANLRSKRRGPRFYRVGRKIYYMQEDLERWIRSNPVETIDSVNA